MGNGAAAGVMAADFLVVMNRVLFLEMLVNLSHQEDPACWAGNPNRLSVSVILLFQTFLHRLLTRRQPLMGAQIAAHPHWLSAGAALLLLFFPDVPPLVWGVSGAGQGVVEGVGVVPKHNSSHSFKHWYIFIKTSTLLIFFLTFFCKNGGVNQYKICMVVWGTVPSLHKRKKTKQNQISEKSKIQRLKTTIWA